MGGSSTPAQSYAAAAVAADAKMLLNGTVGPLVLDRDAQQFVNIGLSLQNNTATTAIAPTETPPAIEFVGGNYNTGTTLNETFKWRFWPTSTGAGSTGFGAVHFKFQYNSGDGTGYHNQFAFVGGRVDGAGNGNLTMRTGVTAGAGFPALHLYDGAALGSTDELFRVSHAVDSAEVVTLSLTAGGALSLNAGGPAVWVATPAGGAIAFSGSELDFIQSGGIGTTPTVFLSSNILGPYTDANVSIGNSGHRWSSGYFGTDAVAQTQTLGLSLENKTAAVAGAPGQQYSPGVQWTSRQWNGAASVPTDWMMQAQAVSGNTIAGPLAFYSRYNGGSWVKQLQLVPNPSFVTLDTGTTDLALLVNATLYIQVGGTTKAQATSTTFQPFSDLGYALGAASQRWNGVYTNSINGGSSATNTTNLTTTTNAADGATTVAEQHTATTAIIGGGLISQWTSGTQPVFGIQAISAATNGATWLWGQGNGVLSTSTGLRLSDQQGVVLKWSNQSVEIETDVVGVSFHVAGADQLNITSTDMSPAASGGVVLGGVQPFGNIRTSGKLTTYNGETTAGVGVRYEEKTGQDVASSGAGAQSTTIATFSPGTSGLYHVEIVISCTTADTVSAVVTYTDAINATAQTLTPISSVACGTNSTTSARLLIRANTSTAILAKISLSSQATTKASAAIERLN